MKIYPVSNIFFTSIEDYKRFKTCMKEKYFIQDDDSQIVPILDAIAADPANKIGEGHSKIAYAIPGIDKFVIAKMKKIPRKNDFLSSQEPKFPEYDFGEPIATNESDLIVMNRIAGISHSNSRWSKILEGLTMSQILISKEEAQHFLSSLEMIEQMPLNAYIDLARKIKYLSDNNQKMDSANPNNLLIDYKNQKFNHIDLLSEDQLEDHKNFTPPLNTIQDMISILLDALLHTTYRDMLEGEDKERLTEISKKIIKKCKIAGEIAGLENNNLNILRMHQTVGMKTSHSDFYTLLYLDFVDLYKEDLFD